MAVHCAGQFQAQQSRSADGERSIPCRLIVTTLITARLLLREHLAGNNAKDVRRGVFNFRNAMETDKLDGGGLPLKLSDVLLMVFIVLISASLLRRVSAPRRRVCAQCAVLTTRLLLAAQAWGDSHTAPKAPVSGSRALPFIATQGSPTTPDGVHAPFSVTRMPLADMSARNAEFLAVMAQRRSVRFFAPDPVPLHIIQQCVEVAGTAPSGAHCQPWTFVVVTSTAVKAAIRAAVEAEEQLNYDRRMRRSWVADVKDLVTGLHQDDGEGGHRVTKPYLTDAPALVVVMKQTHGVAQDGSKVEHYYVEHSVGLAVGMFIAALTNVGLYTLTSTPMGAEGAIRRACGRPEHEKVFLLMPIGWPAEDATVPYRDAATLRKPLDEVMVTV